MSSFRVKLYVYDLSQGMARLMSQQLVGRLIEGIWHTSVVIYEREYYFGQGILTASPGTTHHGSPLQIIDMGETFITQDLFNDFLNEIRPKFTADKYHLLDHNCNTFTNQCCEFLVGRGIPDHIVNLPRDFLNTPFGQSMRPFIESLFGPSRHALSPASSVHSIVNPPAVTPTTTVPSATPAITPSTPIVTARSFAEFNQILQSTPCVIVDFTSETCPPCRMIAPEFERLVQMYATQTLPRGSRTVLLNKASMLKSDAPKIVGIKVYADKCREAFMTYGVSATPTFIGFVRGKKVAEIRGADRNRLADIINTCYCQTYPEHPHKQRAPTLVSIPRTYRTESTCSSLDTIFSKLSTFLHETQISIDIQPLKIYLQKQTTDFDKCKSSIKQIVEMLPINKLFPMIDILRLLVLDTEGRQWVESNEGASIIMDMIYKITLSTETVPRATLLMTQRLLANLVTTPYFLSPSLVKDTKPASTPYRSIITSFIITSLLSRERGVASTALQATWNLCVNESRYRDGEINFGGDEVEEEALHEEWVVELVAAVVETIKSSIHPVEPASDAVITKSDVSLLLKCLGLLVLFADDSVLEVVKALECKEVVEQLQVIDDKEVQNIQTDIVKLLT